ncbi:MAG TPA: GAF and ANTAR domain-containing protein [Actinocrinis sp.]|nr:GAF and ANTAR domain-containing protein [Actinocrinis sp.]
MTREQQLTKAFVQVADALTDDFDVIDFLQQLCARCVDLLDVAAAGVLVADTRGDLQLLAASDERARVLELFALQHDQGPCVACYASGHASTGIDLADPQATGEWPEFADRARADGFTLAHALPLRLRGRVIGALGLFQTDRTPLGEAEIALAQALADVATISLMQQRTMDQAYTEAVHLQNALNSRITLEQVKGILSERWGCTPDDAFAALNNHARSHHLKLTDLAREIAAGSFDTDTISRPATGRGPRR